MIKYLAAWATLYIVWNWRLLTSSNPVFKRELSGQIRELEKL